MMTRCCSSLRPAKGDWHREMIVFELSSRSISRKQNYRARVYGCVHFGAQNVPFAELPSRMVICVKGSSWFGDQRGREPTKRSVSLSSAAVDIGCEVGTVSCATWEVDKKRTFTSKAASELLWNKKGSFGWEIFEEDSVPRWPTIK